MVDNLKTAAIVTYDAARTIHAIVDDSGATDGGPRRMQLRGGAAKDVGGTSGLALNSDIATAVATRELKSSPITVSTASRDLAPTDDRQFLRATDAAPTLVVRAQVDVVYTANMVVYGAALNGITIDPSAGVTLNGGTASVAVGTEAAGAGYTLRRIAENEWTLALGSGGAVLTEALLVSVLDDLAIEPTEGPLGSEALFAILTSAAAAVALEKIGLMNAKAGFDGLGVPSSLTVNEGDIWVAGPLLDTGVRGAAPVSLTEAELVPNTFFHGNSANGKAEPKTYLETFELIESGRPYTGSQAVAIAANVVDFDVSAGQSRHIKTTTALTANSTLSAAPWAGILDGMWPVKLRIETNATPRTFASSTTPAPADGIQHIGYDPAVALAASSYHFFDLYRFDGIPTIEKRGERLIAGAVAPNPEFIAHAVTLNSPTSINIPPHNAGDREVYILHNGANSTLPTIPGALTAVTVDSDAITPGFRLASRQSATTEAGTTTLAGFASVTSGHCMIFRLASGTPQLHATVFFANTVAGDLTPTAGALDAGVNAIYCVHFGCLSTDIPTLPAGLTVMTQGSNSSGVNINKVGYSPVLPTSPGWAAVDGSKDTGVGRCQAVVFAVTA